MFSNVCLESCDLWSHPHHQDPSSSKVSGGSILRILFPPHPQVALCYDGPIWLKHEHVTDSHLYKPFLDKYPYWELFFKKGPKKEIKCVPLSQDIEESPIHNFIDMDVNDKGTWVFLVFPCCTLCGSRSIVEVVPPCRTLR